MKRVGLHLRITDSLVDVARQAVASKLSFFQSFIVRREKKRYFFPTEDEIKAFRAACANRFPLLFAHGSFWVNLSHTQYDNSHALKRELYYAKRLGFTHLVVHAGCATGSEDRMEGVETLVRVINNAMKYEQHVRLVLENTAHARLSVGSDLHDFSLIRERLNHPEKIQFCIDTAHAYAYGYFVETKDELDAFVSFLDEVIGLSSLALIHLNDTRDECGSFMDRHTLVGHGRMGNQTLKQFVKHERLSHIPLILEPPVAPFTHIMESFNTVVQWCE